MKALLEPTLAITYLLLGGWFVRSANAGSVGSGSLRRPADQNAVIPQKENSAFQSLQLANGYFFSRRKPSRVRNLADDGSFEAFVVVDVFGNPRLETSEVLSILQDMFLEAFKTLSNEDDQKCDRNASDTTLPSEFIILKEVELLSEAIDAFGDKTFGDPSVEPIDEFLKHSYLLAANGVAQSPCNYSSVDTPQLFDDLNSTLPGDCECKSALDTTAFVALFNEIIAAKQDSLFESLAIKDILDVTQFEFEPACEETNNVTYFNTTILVTAPAEFLQNEDPNVIEQRFLEAYNQNNFLSTTICDPLRRIVLNVTLGVDNCTATGGDVVITPARLLLEDNFTNASYAPSQAPTVILNKDGSTIDFFMTVLGSCINCEADQNLFDSVDNQRLLNPGSRRRTQADTGLSDEELRCLCPEGAELRGPTIEEVLFEPALCLVELDPVECPYLPSSSTPTTGGTPNDGAEYFNYFRSRLDLTLTLNISFWKTLMSAEDLLVQNKVTSNAANTTFINTLQDTFMYAYNGLIADFCDPFGRQVVHAEIMEAGGLLELAIRKVTNANSETLGRDLSLDASFRVVRRCRLAGTVGTATQESCSGLFFDTVTNNKKIEVGGRRLRRVQVTSMEDKMELEDILPGEEVLLSATEELDAERYVIPMPSDSNQQWLDRRLLSYQHPDLDRSAQTQRRGLLVSPVCDLDRCFCPSDAIARRAPRFAEFQSVFDELLEYVASSDGGNGTYPFAPSFLPSFSSDGVESSSISSIAGICPFKPNPEPFYTLPPTKMPSPSPTVVPTNYPSQFPSSYPTAGDSELLTAVSFPPNL